MSKTARLLYQMTLECRGHGFAASCICEDRIAFALTEAVAVDRERTGAILRMMRDYLQAADDFAAGKPIDVANLRAKVDLIKAELRTAAVRQGADPERDAEARKIVTELLCAMTVVFDEEPYADDAMAAAVDKATKFLEARGGALT